MRNYRYTIISLLLLVIIGFTVWTTFISYRSPGENKINHGPLADAYMEEVNALIFNRYGHPTMEIVSPRMTHYTNNDTTRFEQPHLTIYRKSPKPWYITSRYGEATNGIDTVRFWQNVVVQHPADIKSPATVIKTPTLTVYPESQIAKTTDKITMMQPNIVVKSIGMHANMQTGNINLLSKARGEYAPGY